MKRGTARLILLAGVIWVTFTSGMPHAAISHNKLAANKLAANKLAANKLAANKLAANALSSTKLEANLATAEILATADGREVYAYLVGCAIPAGTTIQANVPGAEDLYCSSGVCTFQGNLGLADYWVDHKLNPQGQRWVSACMMARINLYETAEGISLRGAHDSLTIGSEERQNYAEEEGAFFGNIFTGAADMDLNACRGYDKKVAGFGGGSGGGGLNLRDCTWPDPAHPGQTVCGFNYAGDCASFPFDPEPYSCNGHDVVDGFYDDCHATVGDGQWPASKTYREVITVYTSDF